MTRLIVDDRIAIGIRRWVVNKWGGESLPSYLIHCPWCMSIWFSLLLMPPAVLVPGGISATTIMLAILAIPAASMVAGLLNQGD